MIMMVTVISKTSKIENPKRCWPMRSAQKSSSEVKKIQVQNWVSKSDHNYNKLDNKYLSTIIEAFYKQFDCMFLSNGN